MILDLFGLITDTIFYIIFITKLAADGPASEANSVPKGHCICFQKAL